MLNVGFHTSEDGGSTFTQVRTPHGDNHDLWIAPDDPQPDGRGQRRRRQRDVQRRGELDGAGQPADGAVLSRHHRRTTSPTGSTARSRTTRPCASPAVPTGRRSARADWYPVAGCESGYIAARAGRSGRRLTRAATAATSAAATAAPGRSAPSSVWPENPMGWGAGELKYRFQWTFPDRRLAARPERAVRRGQRAVPHHQRGPELGGDQRRPHPQRQVEAGPVGRPDHQGQHQRRVLRDDLRGGASRRTTPPRSGPARTTVWSTSRATAAAAGRTSRHATCPSGA